MSEQERDYLYCLKQRRDYLTERIQAKKRAQYDIEYDVRERDSLRWAIERIERLCQSS